MANNYIPGFTPSLHGQPVKRMALGGRMESGRWFNEGRDRDTGDMPYTAEVASAAPAVAQSIASSPVAALTAAAPTAAAPTAAAYQQPTPEPAQANYGFDPYDLSGFDMYGLGEYASQFYQQPTPQTAATNYQSLPTQQPVQTAPYVDYATPTSYQRQPTPQPVETAPYYGDYGFDPYGIGNFDMSAYQLPQSGVTAAQSQPTPALPTVASADYSQFMQPYDGSPEMGALPYTAPQSAATSYSPPAASAGPTPPGALPPGMSWGAYSNPNDPTSQYVVNFSGKNKNNPLKVGPDTPVFLYDNRTKQIVASGIGREGADAVAAAASSLGAKEKDAWWDIYTGTPGATDPSQFKVALSDAKNKGFFDRFLSAMGTILPIATAFIPGLGQAGLLTQIGAGAASGAAGAALKGQNILTGALTGGATAGLLNAPVLSGGKNLSGVIGGALESVPVVGDALKGATGALTKAGGSTYNPLTETITTTATKSATPALISGALTSGLQGALNTAAQYPGTVNYGDQVYDKEPSLEEQFDGILVEGGRLPSTAPAVTGGAGSVVSGYDPVKNEITAVADKTKPELDDTASGAAQAAANEIVVTADKKPTSLDDLATGAIGAIAPSLLQPGPQAPTTPPKKDGLSLEDYLRIAGLIASGIGGLGGKGGGGGLSSFAGARGPLNPVFGSQLPAPNMQMATARPMSGVDWYRYGYGPEQSFFTNVPQAAANTSTAYTGYAQGGYAVGGPGDGREDKIPAMLSDGEYVIDAETVAMLGNGSSKAGADALDKFRVNIRKHKGRKLSKGEFSVDAKKPEQYLKGHK